MSVTRSKCRRCAKSKPTGYTYPSQILPNGRTQVVCPMRTPALDLILITLQRHAIRRQGCRVQHYGPTDEKQHHAVLHSRLALVVSARKKAAYVAASGPSPGRKRPRRAAIAGELPHTYLRRSRSAAQLNVGKRRASKGVTNRYEGSWRSS